MFVRIFAYLCAGGDKLNRYLRDPDRSLHPQPLLPRPQSGRRTQHL